MLISSAFAQNAGGGQGGFDIVALLPLILIFVVFYFLLIRPQQKRMKEHRNMVQALRRGDRVVTAGGLIGTVTKVVNDNELQVEVAEGVRVRVVRSTVQEVLSKTEPADKDKEKDEGGQQQSGEGGGSKGFVGKLLGGGGDGSKS